MGVLSVKNLNKPKKRSLNEFLKENNVFLEDSGTLKCKCCDFVHEYKPKEGLLPFNRHINTGSHIKNYQLYTKTLLKYETAHVNSENMHENLFKMMIKCNIPLNITDSEPFKEFFQVNFGFSPKSANFYRGVLGPKIAKKSLNALYIKYSNIPFQVFFDETTISNGKKILNVLIKELSNNITKPEVLWSGEICQTNSLIIEEKILELIEPFIDNNRKKGNFKILVSDGAEYCKRVGRLLKEKISGLKHIICLAHNLHNLATTISNYYVNTSLFVKFFIKLFKNNNTNKEICKKTTKLALPHLPIVTRWGDWINFVVYISKNIDGIGDFIKCLDINKHSDICNLWESSMLPNEILAISKYEWLPQKTKYLEKNFLSMTEALEIYLDSIDLLEKTPFKNRFNEIISKNPDISFFINLSPRKLEREEKVYRNAELTTVCVERSFSAYNNIFTDRRKSLNPSTIFAYLLFK